jgi:hypothetical protein
MMLASIHTLSTALIDALETVTLDSVVRSEIPNNGRRINPVDVNAIPRF